MKGMKWKIEDLTTGIPAVEIFQNRDCDLVIYHSEFKNIQTM